MSRLKRLVKAIDPRVVEYYASTLDGVAESAAALQDEVNGLCGELSALTTQVLEARRRGAELVESYRRDADERVALARLPRARLLSDAVVLDGSPSHRMRVRRIPAGPPVERTFSQWMGITLCASVAPDVRALWDRLLAFEANCGDGVLRGSPSAVLDIPGAIVSAGPGGTLHVSLRREMTRPATVRGDEVSPITALLAVPRFVYAFPPRKLRNFGHWLLDCVPQVVALSLVAPEAVFLLPDALAGFQRFTLLLAGITERQTITWDGAPVAAERLFVLESDGRAGGGRPLSSLVAMRTRIAPAPALPDRRTRRIYVSRRDAKRNRRWVSNEADVEALFASRGFEVLVMADCPLHEQVRIFRDAGVVAGISGAGLTDIVFSAPGTHVIVLLSDSLIRWYADATGARSLWASGDRTTDGQLSALGDSPRFYAHLAVACEQFCHSFLGADDMPLDRLSRFLDEVLRRVDDA